MEFLKAIAISLSLMALLQTQARAENPSKTVFKPKTEHNFNDMDVKGRYQTPMEAVITIENEKVLDDLLGARTNFKDRLKKQAEMR